MINIIFISLIFEEYKAAIAADGDPDVFEIDHMRQISQIDQPKDWGKLSQSDNEDDDMMD